MSKPMQSIPKSRIAAFLAAMAFLALACVTRGPEDVATHDWWEGYGLVIPHDSFPTDCSLCHTGEGWNTLTADFAFDHLVETGTALEGAHSRAQCLRCHNDRGPVAMFASRGCSGCHEDIHLAQLGQNCEDCHEQQDWLPRGLIGLHNRSRFPLVGAHAATACRRCHPGAEVGRFTPTDTECVTCHQSDLARATSPDHMALGWVSDCDRCHIPTTWRGGGFNHGTFPLTGQHKTVDCDECHTNGIFTGLPRDCFGCHADDFAAALDPDHPGLGFPTRCDRCHDTWGWRPADFDHGWVVGSCVNCHLDEYLATNDPDHQAAGFPQNCESCHDTINWSHGTFNHSFPIKGPHDRACIECHLVPNNFSTFSCTHCHKHNQQEMDDEHEDENGYVWESNACLSCHPNGKE